MLGVVGVGGVRAGAAGRLGVGAGRAVGACACGRALPAGGWCLLGNA